MPGKRGPDKLPRAPRIPKVQPDKPDPNLGAIVTVKGHLVRVVERYTYELYGVEGIGGQDDRLSGLRWLVGRAEVSHARKVAEREKRAKVEGGTKLAVKSGCVAKQTVE